MRLKEIGLKNFRNLIQVNFQPQAGLNIISGANAQGKTNLLEAVYFLATTTSFRSGKESNLINHQASCCSVQAYYQKENREIESRISLDREKGKVFAINSKKAHRHHADRLRVVLFTPDDLYLIKGSPARRRDFLDFALTQLSRPYAYELSNYQGLLKRRNEMLRKGQGMSRVFDITDELFVKSAAEVVLSRIRFVYRLQEAAKSIYQRLGGEAESLHLRYALSFPVDSDKINLDILKQALLQTGHEKRSLEIMRKASLLGPHLDDLNIYVGDKLARLFASQGQQRILAIVLKLAELYAFADIKGFYPLFLLDEVLAELDQNHKALLLQELSQADYQSFLTSVETISVIPNQASNFLVKKGIIVRKEK
ncbi:MAG: DNA replication/repair protein RecF [Syntrophomonadaceae bacterium]|mgnify:FL=1|nr:DNA replication/repair protein RecF [Syntrophomonadaceae bacterium]